MPKDKSEIAKYRKELIKTLTEDLADLNKVIPQLDLQLKQNMGARTYIQLLLKKLKDEKWE
ncbi:hypothetical protein LCGC14_0406530 [marine sediment metagenome]|uniref:Uncharacterized protein n=1 Tax=marine sediment metagenome TaxID=412755 RepID=A0A0F9W453_9ZZZZ